MLAFNTVVQRVTSQLRGLSPTARLLIAALAVIMALLLALVAMYAGQSELVPLGHELVDRIEAEGRADLVPTFTRRFPFAIICRQLGLPRDREPEFYDWSMELMFGGMDLAKSRAADALLTEYVTPVIEARRREPRDDVISGWLGTEVDGAPARPRRPARPPGARAARAPGCRARRSWWWRRR